MPFLREAASGVWLRAPLYSTRMDARDSDRPTPPPPANAPVLDYRMPGAARIAQPPATMWTTVYTCRNLLEANLAVAALRGRGMEARVDSENAAPHGAWVGQPDGTRVQVPTPDVPQAQVLLREIDDARARRLRRTKVHCPRCDAEAKSLMHPLRNVALAILTCAVFLIALRDVVTPIAFVVAVFLGGVLLLWTVTPRWRCPSCGHRWSQPEPDESDEDEEEDQDEDESRET